MAMLNNQMINSQKSLRKSGPPCGLEIPNPDMWTCAETQMAFLAIFMVPKRHIPHIPILSRPVLF